MFQRTLNPTITTNTRRRMHSEDLMARGLLEISQLKEIFKELEKKGPVKTCDDVMKWSILASAVKEGAVSSGIQAIALLVYITGHLGHSASQTWSQQWYTRHYSAANVRTRNDTVGLRRTTLDFFFEYKKKGQR